MYSQGKTGVRLRHQAAAPTVTITSIPRSRQRPVKKSWRMKYQGGSPPTADRGTPSQEARDGPENIEIP